MKYKHILNVILSQPDQSGSQSIPVDPVPPQSSVASGGMKWSEVS